MAEEKLIKTNMSLVYVASYLLTTLSSASLLIMLLYSNNNIILSCVANILFTDTADILSVSIVLGHFIFGLLSV